MPGFARLWAVTALIAGVVGENQCHDKECIAPSVAGDENSLLQIADGQHLGGQVGKGPGYGLLQFNLSKCAESFACGVLSGKVGSKFGGFKGFLATGGTAVSCGAVATFATTYFKDKDLENSALDAHKAQSCTQKKLSDLIGVCENKIMETQEMPQTGTVAWLINKCQSQLAPNNKFNLTISSELYKKCGFPGIAQKLVAAKKPPGTASQLEASECQVAGLASVQLHNFLTMMKQVQEENKKDDQEAEAQEATEENNDYEVPDGCGGRGGRCGDPEIEPIEENKNHEAPDGRGGRGGDTEIEPI